MHVCDIFLDCNFVVFSTHNSPLVFCLDDAVIPTALEKEKGETENHEEKEKEEGKGKKRKMRKLAFPDSDSLSPPSPDTIRPLTPH